MGGCIRETDYQQDGTKPSKQSTRRGVCVCTFSSLLVFLSFYVGAVGCCCCWFLLLLLLNQSIKCVRSLLSSSFFFLSFCSVCVRGVGAVGCCCCCWWWFCSINQSIQMGDDTRLLLLVGWVGGWVVDRVNKHGKCTIFRCLGSFSLSRALCFFGLGRWVGGWIRRHFFALDPILSFSLPPPPPFSSSLC